jgi:lipopolysaccharide transport system ATP-binding protein
MSILEIQNLSKQYRLGNTGTNSLGHDINRWWYTVRGKEDPYLKIGETNDRALTANSEYVWALQNINLKVEQGEVLGIIGANGAGKSTLLKILSRVTGPTTGKIITRGRIASLLEVGTGFHGDLTGRENIYLNGAILGMTKREITSKLDEIIDFSGCERYIDTPVKRYSSGMYVRLAFAVAAHLEPEILIIDEVLAVGDAEFQKKAIGKMKDVSQGQGRTVLFVSHNMVAVQSICNRSALMVQGTISAIGPTESIISSYLSCQSQQKESEYEWQDFEMPGNDFIAVKKVAIEFDYQKYNKLDITTPFQIYIQFKNRNKELQLNISLVLKNLQGDIIFNVVSEVKVLFDDEYFARLYIPANYLNDGNYTIDVYYVKDKSTVLFLHKESIHFEIFDIAREDSTWYGKWIGAVRPTLQWDFNKI